MALPRREKHYIDSRAKKHSELVVSQRQKSKKDKDTGAEMISSSNPTSADTVVVIPPPEPKKCPLRFVLADMFEIDEYADVNKPRGCPLRRVRLWHTIPLVILAIINLVLVTIALLGLAGFRIAVGVQELLASLFRTDLDDPYAENVAESNEEALMSVKSGGFVLRDLS